MWSPTRTEAQTRLETLSPSSFSCFCCPALPYVFCNLRCQFSRPKTSTTRRVSSPSLCLCLALGFPSSLCLGCEVALIALRRLRLRRVCLIVIAHGCNEYFVNLRTSALLNSSHSMKVSAQTCLLGRFNRNLPWPIVDQTNSQLVNINTSWDSSYSQSSKYL